MKAQVGACWGWRTIVAAVFTTSLVWMSVLLVVSTTIHSTPSSSLVVDPAGTAERVRFQQTLDHYNVLARNMTRRIRTAEQAVQQLQQRRHAQQVQPGSAKPSVALGVSVAKGGETITGSAASEAEGETTSEVEETEEEGESDEDRDKRQNAEAAEQLVLIGFNETTKSFRRWRPDFKCGDTVPVLPDNEIVECEPGSETPCCSALGWCGKSEGHCTCPLCTDYRSSVQIKFKGLKLKYEKRECDNIAADLKQHPSPEACAPAVLNDVKCGRSLMYAKAYPDWGCRCCAALDTGSADVHESWNVYEIEVEITPKVGGTSNAE